MRKLVHLTNEAGVIGIVAADAISSSHGVFVLPAHVPSESIALKVFCTGLARGKTAAQWWQTDPPNYLQWSIDIGTIETTYTDDTTDNILQRAMGVKNAGVKYATDVGKSIKDYDVATAAAREEYISKLMTIAKSIGDTLLDAERDKEIALADAELQKQLTGNESAYSSAVQAANDAYTNTTTSAEASRKSQEQTARSTMNTKLSNELKDKDADIAAAEREYDQTVASLDAQYGSASSNGDTGAEGATRRSAIKTRDAQYYADRDTSWANTLSGSTTLGTSPWIVKAISAANTQAAHSSSRANAQAAHDAAMLEAIEDWQDATSTAFFNSLVSSSNAKRDYTNSLAGHWADWDEATDGKTGEAPDVPTESMVDSIIGILNPFDTESIANAAITKPSDVPRRPDPSEIKLVYSIYGIVSEHTPEEWEVIREYQTRGRTWEDWLYGNERERMENAGFKTSFRHLDEETPPSKIPTPSILPSPPPILPESPAPVEPPGNTTIPMPEAEPQSGLGLTDTIIGVFGGTRGDYVDQYFNFLYGVGDNMSLGIGWWLRSTFFDDQADYGGNSYYIGSWVGFVVDLATGLPALGKFFAKELFEQGLRNVANNGKPAHWLYSENEAIGKVLEESLAFANRILNAATKNPPAVTSVIFDARTGRYYHGVSGGAHPEKIAPYLQSKIEEIARLAKEKGLANNHLENWKNVWNCAEFHALNRAILDGGNLDDLFISSFRPRGKNGPLPMPPCKNCTVFIEEVIHVFLIRSK